MCLLIYLRSHAVSAENKLFVALRFYATGSFQNLLGDSCGVSQQTTSRIVKEVSNAIAMLKDEFIFMPRNVDALRKNFSMFYDIGCFPTVAGTIDCTHIKISGQGGDNGEIYRNRKQFFSLNIQSISSADLKFQDIVARWPGSTHDSHIFNQSRIKQRFEDDEFKPAVLLGDGGYKLYPYLMTPFRNPMTADEQRYNRMQILVRNTVERKYGVWKRRFPCLVFGFRCKLETSLVVIVACAVLHNFCIEQKDDLPAVDPVFEEAVRLTTLTATEEIEDRTNNSNRQAVMKREAFVRQIAELN